jgi:hypothetical protein
MSFTLISSYTIHTFKHLFVFPQHGKCTHYSASSDARDVFDSHMGPVCGRNGKTSNQSSQRTCKRLRLWRLQSLQKIRINSDWQVRFNVQYIHSHSLMLEWATEMDIFAVDIGGSGGNHPTAHCLYCASKATPISIIIFCFCEAPPTLGLHCSGVLIFLLCSQTRDIKFDWRVEGAKRS